MISVQAPGKLYIAGEYAVVEYGMPSIIVALNQFITVKIKAGKKYGSIISKQYQENSIYWRRQGNQMVFDNRDNPFHYILSAIKITEEYARSLNKNLGIYHLKINSQLDSPDGRKYGLGSSAAVTVATINALCKFYKIPITQNKLFKLAAIAHLEVQGNGSLGDIAASVYGGWIAYNSFNRQWLKIMRYKTPINQLIDQKWPQLKIEQLTPPKNLKLLIGWTGSPASTSNLVDKVSLEKAKQHHEYSEFLEGSKKCIEQIIKGFHLNDLKLIQNGISKNRNLLNSLGHFTHVDIETPSLKKLCQIAIKHGGAAKSSGAGGGDCGIVIIDKSKSTTSLLKEWQKNHIKRLNFNIHNVIKSD
ncbi:phosphomevalonate kinase [Philodulcilactobacillus myokoensis]|uniref:phosphomevalonate kinase n=1 Tax=Philodulcilactobacillus myokoensis TaxID=2929573 RepID=A0A9W6ESY7_9LACO|nr:phosphomevalonate kinase [Philodulcilactobacillus myokoensis]GLB46838.1 phosphomevalonate kinase [Philodulcilactobacillus myokoensis]